MHTFEQAKQLFLFDRKGRGLTQRTIDEYENSLKIFLEYTHLNSIQDCTKEVVNGWILYLSQTRKPVTACKYIRDIRAFLYFCMEQEYIKPYKIKCLKKQEETVKYYTDEEIAILAKKPEDVADYAAFRTWAMISFALGTGARLSTILNVHMSDIDWNAGTVEYRHTKNKKSAIVPISSTLMLRLKEFIIRYDIDEEGVLFPDVTGGQLSTEGAYRALTRYCEHRHIERHSWHSFRHSFARTAILKGCDVIRLQTMMQHSSIEQTQHYARIFGTDLKNIEKYTPLDNLPTPKKHKYK